LVKVFAFHLENQRSRNITIELASISYLSYI
jgi:hypothetical protein